MSFDKGQHVEIVDWESVNNDELLEDRAKDIIGLNQFKGEVTKIENDIYFVGFKNDLGWVTQGFKSNEIKGVK